MSYQQILVAIDRSPQGEAVFQQALELAKQSNAKLTVFYCLPKSSGSASSYSNIYGQELSNFSDSIQEDRQQEREEVEQWLTNYCQHATEEGVTSEWHCQADNADRAICEFAKSNNIDLIVLGRRGRKRLEEMFLGSVSNYVVHHASCSVLVVQGI